MKYFRATLFLLFFALLGWAGGTTTQQWLEIDGTLAAPSYSFSGETDNGFYRYAASQLCATGVNDLDGLVCFDDGQLLLGSTTTTSGYLYESNPAKTYFVALAESTERVVSGMDDATDISLGHIGGYPAISGYRPSSAPTSYTAFRNTSNNLQLYANVSAFATSNYIGYGTSFVTETGLNHASGELMRLVTGADCGVRSTNADEIEYVIGGNVVGYSRNKDVYEAAPGNHIQLYNNGSAGVGAACDAAAESGRLRYDYLNNRLEVCNFNSGRGWDYVDFAE